MPAKSPAQTLLDKADKKANSSAGWFSSSSGKFEEAGDLYQQAANSFKLEKLFKEAGDCFAREAECREKGGEANEAANAWWNAAKAYKRGFPDCESRQTRVPPQALLILLRSGYSGSISDDHTFNQAWSVSSGRRQGERDRSDISSRIERSPQSMRKLCEGRRMVRSGRCHCVSYT